MLPQPDPTQRGENPDCGGMLLAQGRAPYFQYLGEYRLSLSILALALDGVLTAVGSCERRFMVILRHRLPGGWLRSVQDRFEGP